MHFDYPYYAEPNDGLNDEILGTVWSREGNVKLVGSEIPADAIVEGTPKFGYRCLQSQAQTDFITTDSLAFSLDASSNYEFSCFIRIAASQAGYLMRLYSGEDVIFSIAINANNTVSVACSAWSLSFSSTETLTLNTWAQLAIRLNASTCTIIIDDTSATSSSFTRTALTPTACTIGGFNGQVDEFMFRDTFSTSLPTQPIQATLNVQDLGGFGNGRMGSYLVATSTPAPTGAYAKFTVPSPSASLIAVSNIRNNQGFDFSVGDELLLLNNETGDFEFRDITLINGNYFTLNKPTTLSGDSLQIVKVYNVYNFTVNSGCYMIPYTFTNDCGGVIAIRAKGNVTVNGSILTSGYGRTRNDLEQMTHSRLVDKFICNRGGGIMIFCGGTLTLSSTARIGASWDGSLKGGTGGYNAVGSPGGAGYGAGGGGDNNASTSRGGNGGVGGAGGGGEDNCTGGNAGQTNTTGGYGRGLSYARSNRNYTMPGGTQGIGVDAIGSDYIDGVPGAGAGGTARAFSDCGEAYSGANVLIIAKKLNADMAAISTGGARATKTGTAAPGGGGTGFCYIACEEMI